MKKIIVLLVSLVFLMVGNAFADADWCKNDGNDQPILPCITSIFNAANAEILATPEYGLVGGTDADKNAIGYYKLVAGAVPPLQEHQVYSGWLYTFVSNEFIKTRNVIMNYDNMTLVDFKWSKYWEFYNAFVQPPRTADCTYIGYTIPQSARLLMVEAVTADKTVTYEVYNSSTGMPAYFTRTAAQAKGVLDACLIEVDFANATMKTKADEIMACGDGTCINAITWE